MLVYSKQRNKNTPAKTVIRRFVCASPELFIIVPNSNMVRAVIMVNNMVNGIGPPKMQLISMATNMIPVIALFRKLLLTVVWNYLLFLSLVSFLKVHLFLFWATSLFLLLP